MVEQKQEQIGDRKPITRAIVSMIARNVGFGAIVLDLWNVDYSRGSRRIKDGQEFWLNDGRRVEVTLGRGCLVASVSKEPDENIPEPLTLEEGE